MEWKEKFLKGFHVEELNYFFSQEHALMGLGEGKNNKLDNIGKNGSNLTIAVLSMNRSGLTIRLMESIKNFIPEFSGEFLIGDNGSENDEKRILYSAIDEMPFRCRIIEFGENFGVAGGRNRLFKEANTDWILSADNDLYFIGNPLDKIQKDISILGCHFLGLPILNKEGYGTGIYGGHIYIENINNKVSIDGGSVMISSSVETNQNNPPFLCTFVPGGASVMNKQTFYECGGYDSGMFVGFEDVEFSLRLYQKGLKVGACGMASIIHDHPEPEKISDADYERIRFSGQRIGNSGRYFEKKHGFSVWNPETEKWVGDRLKQLLSDTQSDTVYIEKSSIALIIDAKNWALDHIADQITDKLKNKYHFKKIYLSEFDNLTDIFLLASQCQLIHFMWRPLLSTYYNHSTQSKIPGLGMTEDDFYQKFIKNKKISVDIYDHLLLDGKNREITQALFSDPKSLVDFYTVSTKKLKRVYDEDPNIKMKPTAVIPDGVDLEIFKPKNLKRFENITNRAIKVGWVGNSKWEVSDLKGINTIIKPAINILKSKGYNLELITSDRQIKGIPFEEMQDFYSNIDIYVCASLHEGTPNPVLEAMACGIPVVSTNVGLVPELFGQRQTDFILEERSVKCLVSTLEVLLNNPEYFKLLSDENLTSIMVWDWKIVVNNFDEYFDKCINL